MPDPTPAGAAPRDEARDEAREALVRIEAIAAECEGRDLDNDAILSIARKALAAAPRADPEPTKVERLAAMLLCKSGDVEDPRFADVRSIPIDQLPRTPSAFTGVSRPLTDQQVRDVLAKYFAAARAPGRAE